METRLKSLNPHMCTQKKGNNKAKVISFKYKCDDKIMNPRLSLFNEGIKPYGNPSCLIE